jgi:hypothetical protein
MLTTCSVHRLHWLKIMHCVHKYSIPVVTFNRNCIILRNSNILSCSIKFINIFIYILKALCLHPHSLEILRLYPKESVQALILWYMGRHSIFKLEEGKIDSATCMLVHCTLGHCIYSGQNFKNVIMMSTTFSDIQWRSGLRTLTEKALFNASWCVHKSFANTFLLSGWISMRKYSVVSFIPMFNDEKKILSRNWKRSCWQVSGLTYFGRWF